MLQKDVLFGFRREKVICRMSEYRIVFKDDGEGGMDVYPEVVGEDETPITKIGDYFYSKIQDQLERFAEELESE